MIPMSETVSIITWVVVGGVAILGTLTAYFKLTNQ